MDSASCDEVCDNNKDYNDDDDVEDSETKSSNSLFSKTTSVMRAVSCHE